MSESTEIARPMSKGERWSPEQKTQVVAHALERMEDGESLEAVGQALDINPGTIWHWINADEDACNRYENSKICRARGFVERALHAIETDSDYKRGESRARMYLRLAAILNPKEFSDKMHTAVGKQGSGPGRLSFTLVFPGAQAQDMGELRVIPQPEDGELP